MSQSLDFYKTEVCRWRGVGAIGVSAMLIPVTSFAVTALLSASLVSPYSWLRSMLWSVLSPASWFYIVIMCSAYVLLVSHKQRFFSVTVDYGTTRLSRLLSVCKLNKLCHVTAQAAACGAILWCLLAITGGRYRNLTHVEPETGMRYLNEAHVFLLLHAIYIGLVSAVCFYTHYHYVIRYPLIQQPKWNAGRDHGFYIIKDSMLFVVGKILYFYILYYVLLGGVVKRWFGRYMVISDAVEIDSVWGILDAHLFLWTCMTGAVLVFFLDMFSFIYTLYQTEPFEMTIQASVDGSDQCKLTDGLIAHSFPLFQYQGYQDLYLLSKQSPQRRALLFSLSPLGGHPHNWTEISEKCLKELNAFTQEVHKFNAASLGNGSATYTSPINVHNGMDSKSSDTKPAPKRSLKQKIYNNLQQRKALSYFLSTPPDVALQQLLAHAQKHSWNVQALSNLVIASFTEDKYGVVQKSLADVITAMVTLRDGLEKMCKLAGTGAKSDAHSVLRVSLKSSLYNIVNTFSPHLDAINLSADVRKKLKLFAEYKV